MLTIQIYFMLKSVQRYSKFSVPATG